MDIATTRPSKTAFPILLDGFLYIWYLVVFVAMGFGIVNTTLMAVYERMREFGLLKALGMKPRWILREVLTESFLLLICGVVVGNILGLLTIMKRMNTEKMVTFIFSTHDKMVMDYAGRLILIRDGRIEDDQVK